MFHRILTRPNQVVPDMMIKNFDRLLPVNRAAHQKSGFYRGFIIPNL